MVGVDLGEKTGWDSVLDEESLFPPRVAFQVITAKAAGDNSLVFALESNERWP